MLDSAYEYILHSTVSEVDGDSVCFFDIKPECYVEHLAGVHTFHNVMETLEAKLV